MAPRRSGYGSLGAGRGEPGFDDPSDSTPVFDHVPSSRSADTTTSSTDNRYLAPSSSSSGGAVIAGGGRSWWRMGFLAGVAATALTLGVSVARFSGDSSSSRGSSSGVGKGAAASRLDEISAAYHHGSTFQSQQQQQQQQQQQRESAAPRVVDTGASSELAFVALNDYTRRGDVVGAGYPWLEGKILVEPYRTTSLEVVSPSDGMSYSWEVYQDNGEEDGRALLGKYYGDVVEVVFEKAPQYVVVLQEYRLDEGDESGGIVISRRSESEVFCKWVRREIRSLFDDDRNEMFDTMKVLWDVSTEDGQKIYGENYLDVWDIDKFHQVGASDINCDHLHDGIGFGITHSMVTTMFETSMQLVNPKVSLPYWDFTIDSAIVDTVHDGDYTKAREVSDLWTEDWFGGVDPVDWQVKDGRWGYLEVPIIAQEHRDLMGADVFGRMRSPWNVNDKPYLVRGLGEMCGIASTGFYKWPTCETHYDMQDLYTSYYSYTWQSQYQPHGPMHVWVGGNVDCKKDMDATIAIVGEEYRLSITGYSFIMRKGLFRDHLWKCHGFADAETSAMDVMLSGQCGCTDLDLEHGDDYIYIYELFANGKYDFPEFTESEKRKLAIQYCNGVVGMGESSQSSSPLDPTFWSLHPTMERLLSFKLLAGGFADYSWPDSPGTWTGMDGVEYDVIISVQDDECLGHRGSDVFPYGILSDLITPVFNFHGTTGPNTYSNRELIHFFDPKVNALTYIYDNFDWSHCAEQGFDFKDFFDTATGKPGFATTTDSTETSASTGKRKVNGYGIFKQGEPRGPLYDAPPIVKLDQ